MAERLADFADVHSGFEKFNRERMPELMGAASFKPRSLRGFQREGQMSKVHGSGLGAGPTKWPGLICLCGLAGS